MFKNYYTTAMSSNGKLIKERFSNIATVKKYGKAAGIMTVVLTMAVMTASLFASAVLADTIFAPDEITVLYNGKAANLKNKPFIDNSEYYVPLRETLNLCGVADDNITYLDGRINMLIHSDITDSDYTAHITVGKQNIKFDGEQGVMASHTDGERTTTHPAILRDGVTYVPLGMMIRIKQYDIEISESEALQGFRYANTKPVKLLKGLQIRKYDIDGKFDVLLTDWTIAESQDPKDYYEDGEKVFIGTEQEQETLGYDHNETNYYHFPLNPIKRILIDDEGKVKAIVLIENQRHEAINGGVGRTTSCVFGWDSAYGGMTFPNTGIPKSDTENASPFNHKDFTWALCDYKIADPETAKGNQRSLECFYIPVELITRMDNEE